MVEQRRLKGLTALFGVIVAAFALQACREEEQDRILLFEKGVYLGEPDQELDEATREQLRQRARLLKE